MELGGVGIVCHAAGRGNKTVHVKALVEGGEMPFLFGYNWEDRGEKMYPSL
jgi:hypothetical protein